MKNYTLVKDGKPLKVVISDPESIAAVAKFNDAESWFLTDGQPAPPAEQPRLGTRNSDKVPSVIYEQFSFNGQADPFLPNGGNRF